MSKVAIVGDPSGTGTFTISAPNGNTDRTLVLPDEAGTVLTSAGVPASAMPVGSVLQVVNETLATAISGISSKTTILSASITPTSATSKILVITQCSVGSSSISNAQAYLGIDRNGVTLPASSIGGLDTANGNTSPLNVTYLDSPATTSPITYTTWVQRNSGGTSSCAVYSNGALDRRGQLTLMEIAG